MLTLWAPISQNGQTHSNTRILFTNCFFVLFFTEFQELLLLGTLKDCIKTREPISPRVCRKPNLLAFRTIEGFCNNLRNPNQGASETEVPRLLRKWKILFRNYCLLDTGCKLNVHKTFRRHPGRPLNVLSQFCLSHVSGG